ncbi:MAG: hypothetical protein NTW74_19980 [Acidobacteria bacterium]|nr:hypothetical protein [Acidobacteriota bacterium]
MVLEDNHYIFRLRESCLAQPEWNRHQLLALDHEISLAGEANTVEEYLESSGDLLELTRAGSLDRASNLVRIAESYDDPWLAAAARLEYVHACEGNDHAAMYAAILKGQQAAASLRVESCEIGTSIDRLFQSLLRFHTSSQEQELNWNAALTAFRFLRSHDPAFCIQTWIEQPRYRLRLPWISNTPHEWLEGLWFDEAPSYPHLLADFEVAQSRWASRLRGGGEVRRPAAPLEVLESPCIADVYLDRQAVWADPVLARHAGQTRRAIQSATTAIGREAVAEDRNLNFQIEASWNSLLLSTLLAPYRAIAIHGCLRDAESHAAILQAFRCTHSLVGCGPRDIATIPLVACHLENNFWPRLKDSEAFAGALQGEAGLDLLQQSLAWQQVAGRVHFEEFMFALELPDQSSCIHYWGRQLPLRGLAL